MEPKYTKTIKLLLIPAIFSAVFFALAKDARAENYYASPSGTGNGLSESTPFKIVNFWTAAKPGDTLYLLDGIYRGADSMITPPSGVSGSRGQPITIKAVNDGEARIDGENTQNSGIYLGNTHHWFVIEGIDVCCTKHSVIEIARNFGEPSTNHILKRVIAWDAGRNQNCDSNDEVFNIQGENILFEDCAGWGSGRKIFGGIGNRNTTYRRCFFRWTYFPCNPSLPCDPGPTCHTGEHWKLGLTYNYDADNSLVENCIGTWDAYDFGNFNQGQEFAIFGVDGEKYRENSGTGYKIYGNIAYFLQSQKGDLVLLGSDGSSTYADEPSYFKDNVYFTDRDDVGTFGAGADGTDLKSFVGSHLTSIGGKSGEGNSMWIGDDAAIDHVICQDSAGTCTRAVRGASFDYVMYWNNFGVWSGTEPNVYIVQNPDLLGTCGDILQYGCNDAARPRVNGEVVGAQIKYRYVDGILHDGKDGRPGSEPLWPWPMNGRIKDAMVASAYDKKGGLNGKGSIDLTKTVFELGGGTVPPDFDTTPPSAPTGLQVN